MLLRHFPKPVFIFFVLLCFIISCTPPRSIIHSGKVTPHKQVRAGVDYSANIPTHFVQSLYDNVDMLVTPLVNNDTIILNDQLLSLNRTALAYAIEPIGMGYNFNIRYGIAKKLDAGYSYSSGTHVFSSMYQFLGSSGTFTNPGEERFNGSTGIQYSSKSYELPSWSGLDKVQPLLGFGFKRKDILIPLVFSFSFGEEEKYGNISFGAVYSHSFIRYGFSSQNIVDTLNAMAPKVIEPFQGKSSYSSLGGFVNFKLGYKYVYLLPALAVYYQDYGAYKLIDGSEARFKGFTFIPSVGLQINISDIITGVRKGVGKQR